MASENADSALRNEIENHFELKEESIGPPKPCLGGSVRTAFIDTLAEAWVFSSWQHVVTTVNNVQIYSKEQGLKVPKRAKIPIQTSYRPELDISHKLGPK